MSDVEREEKKELDKLLEYFKKEETQEKIAALAIQINKVFGMSWFTLKDCTKIFKEASVQQLVDILRTLNLCGFLLVNTKKQEERFRLSSNHFKKVTDVLGK